MNEHTQISLRLSRIMMNQEVQGKASLLQDKLIVILASLSSLTATCLLIIFVNSLDPDQD